MLVLGLGSNIGDRLSHLRQAILALEKNTHFKIEKISPIYISQALLPDQAPSEWNKPYLNIAILCHSDLSPYQVLEKIKKIEKNAGRINDKHWAPRVIDIDILAWDDLLLQNPDLTIPHIGLTQRPFALWPLADILPLWLHPLENKTASELCEAWGSRFDAKAPFATKQLNQRIQGPALMGIINITPDSFSDGGLFFNPELAVQQAKKLIEQGAEIIDIGAESTAPTALGLDAQTEWQRLSPVLSLLQQSKHEFLIPPKISIDTRHVYTAEKCLDFDIDWINDVSGLDHPAMRDLLKSAAVDCVIMHHLSLPEKRSHLLARHIHPFETVFTWGKERLHLLEKSGFDLDRLIFDPGIGFGKVAEQSLLLLQQSADFKKLGCRLLIGHSRKTFFSNLTGQSAKDRDLETSCASLFLANQGMDYLRVHNVEINARALKVMQSLKFY